MKKLLLIMCVCAILLTGTACKKNKDNDVTDDTGEVKTEDTQERETIDLDGDGISDGYIIEGIPGDDGGPTEDDDSEDGSNDASNDPSESGADTPDSSGNQDTVTPTTDTMKSEVISQGGTEEGLWPEEEIPEDVPAYEDYSKMYQVTHDEGDTSEEWYLSFDSTEKDYNEWVKKLEAEGYRESDKIVGFWGNGEQILNLFTEEIDGDFCVSIDIFKSKPVEYPETVSKIFPEFENTDSTLYGWYITDDEPKTLSVSYACGSNFAGDLNIYKNKLSEAGFTVTESEATKEVDGVTYSVRYGDAVNRYEDCLEYVYYK